MKYITDKYREHANQQPEKLAIRRSNEEMNYREWYEVVNRTANWLDSLQEKRRRVIAFLLPNGIPFMQLFAGAAHAGWTAVPIDEKWTPAEIADRLRIACPAIVVGPRDMFPDEFVVKSLQDYLQEISHMPSRYMADVRSNVEEVTSKQEIFSKRTEPFYMGFTSGTTGRPKAFLRSQLSWVSSYICSEMDFGVIGEQRILVPGALVHSHFLYGAIHALHAGATIELLEKFSVTQVKERLESGKVDTVYVVPTMMEALLREGIHLPRPVKAISSGAKWQDQAKLELACAGFETYELYGASELSFVTVMGGERSIEEHEPRNSVGRACTGVEIEIRRADGSFATPNETGKIFVRSGLLFDGYLQADGTIETIHDARGFITVDDMGWLDEAGYLHIAGREKNMILYGALNLYPEEIERVLMRHSNVLEVAVVGVPNDYWGEIAVAAIRGSATKLELQRWCKLKGLAAYKIPRRWYFIEEMPYTTSGKVARAELRGLIGEEVHN